MPTLKRPSPAMVVAVLALVASLVGTATAATLISGRTIRRNSIPADRIKNNSLGDRQINERRLDRVNRARFAERARVAEVAGGSFTVGGMIVRKVSFRVRRNTPQRLVTEVNGLQIYAACAANGQIQARAVTTATGTQAQVGLVFAGPDDTFGSRNPAFDPGEQIDLDRGQPHGAGTFTYSRSDGVIATMPYSVSSAIAGTAPCVLTGTATSG